MTKETFTKQLKERLEEITECVVEIHTTTKNNGIKLESLTIMREGKNTYPTIYIDIWWDIYNKGESFENIITKVLEWERKSAVNKEIDLDFFMDFNQVKEKLRYKIINTEKNLDLLNSIPHKDFLDLSKVYMVEVYTPQIGNGTIMIHNKHLEMWGTKPEEIDRYAAEQTEKHNPYCILPIEKVVKNIVTELAGTEETIPEFTMPPMEMYVLTNREKYLGASVLLYQNVLKNFAKEKKDDIYILPSSTHELILIPARVVWYTGIKHLKEMVKEVNSTQVEPEEFLSDNVYMYNRFTDKIEIV